MQLFQPPPPQQHLSLVGREGVPQRPAGPECRVRQGDCTIHPADIFGGPAVSWPSAVQPCPASCPLGTLWKGWARSSHSLIHTLSPHTPQSQALLPDTGFVSWGSCKRAVIHRNVLFTSLEARRLKARCQQSLLPPKSPGKTPSPPLLASGVDQQPSAFPSLPLSSHELLPCGFKSLLRKTPILTQDGHTLIQYDLIAT